MTTGNISIPEELLPQVEQLARAENSTPDEVVAEAVKQLIGRRFWERNRRESAERRGNMTDEQLEQYVDEVIHKFRSESRHN